MLAMCEYQQNYSLNAEGNSHQQIIMNKRKHHDMEDKENIITAQSILERALKDKQPEHHVAKRRQTKSLFRPWEDVESNKHTNQSDITTFTELPKSVSPVQALSNVHSNVTAYHPNTTHQYGLTSCIEKEQQKRNRNTVPYLISRRNKQAEQFMLQQQQYVAQQQYMAHHHYYQQSVMMEQSMRAAMYMRHLQEIALQRQQQLFVFGQQY